MDKITSRAFEGFIAGVALWIGISIARRKQSEKKSVVGKVTGIFIYPLKSGNPNKHESAYAAEMGLVQDGLLDRSIVARKQDSNIKITGREAPMLTQVTTKKLKDTIILSAPGMEDFHLTEPEKNLELSIDIFGQMVDAVDAGDAAARWISKYLEVPSRLTIKPKNRNLRPSDQNLGKNRDWRLSGLKKDLNVASFQDGFPFMMLSDQSLGNINAQIPGRNYTHQSFRPNITISNTNGEAWAEDEFIGELHIGDAIFAVASSCPRCVFTTIDPFTSKRSVDYEPLRTLKKIRMVKGKDEQFPDFKTSPIVGVNLVIIQRGEIKVGDELILYPK